MKGISKLSLLALSLLVSACNEKVAPELTKGEATVPDVAVPPSEYYFNVTNTSPALLNYNLHKTGIGNQTAPCEVRSTTALSSDTFRGDPAKNDITCYFDAEELSLLHGGMEFSVNSSANSCDYIGYSPFSYFERMPGDSTGTYLEIECTNDTTSAGNVVDAALARGIPINTNTTALTCGDIASSTIPAASRAKFQLSDDDELCRFNYEASGGPNCDIGTVTVQTLSVTYTPADGPTPAVLKHALSSRVISCGGKVASCIGGPLTNLTKTLTKATEISETVINQPFTKEYELEPLISLEKENNLKPYVNFRRHLASLNIDYRNPADAGYRSAFHTTFVDTLGVMAKTFNPEVMDSYSKNKRLDGTGLELITTGVGGLLDQPTVKFQNSTYTAKPLAAEPFLGIPPYTTNPFYTFYCYDTAFDIKARIRMMVREWDRVSPGFNSHDFISDIGAGDHAARQDSVVVYELDGNYDGHLLFNDLQDWDDHIPMMRSPGNFDANTIWQPVPEGIYTQGWFNPTLFPN